MKSKRVLKLVTLAVSVLMVAGLFGCSSQANNQLNSKPSIVAGAKKEGGIIRTSISAEPDNLDPYLSAASDTEAIMGNVFEGLMGYDESGATIPRLAEKCDISQDGLKYTFTLRKGVKFHNGKEFKVEDVKYSYEKLSGLNGEKPLSSKFTTIKSIETPDENTVAIILKDKDASFLARCIVAVVPKGYDNQGQKPIGTGPFKFSEYVAGQKVVLEKNNEYYDQKRKASIDKVEFRIMTDSSAILMALKAGDLDLAGISAKDIPSVQKDFEVMQAPQNMVQLFALNNSVKPFNDLKVRQAINYAIDKNSLINVVGEGCATQLDSNMSPIMKVFYQDGLDKYKYNVEKSKALLKEAGYENGFSTTVTVPSNYKFHVDTAQMIADQLSKVGIKLEIKQIEWAQWLDQVYTKADYNSTVIAFTGKLDPNDVLGRYESKYPKNFVKFSDTKYDELIKNAMLETDEKKRSDMYKECQKILVDQAASVFIMDPNLIMASKKNLKGFKFFPVRFLDMSKMYYTE